MLLCKTPTSFRFKKSIIDTVRTTSASIRQAQDLENIKCLLHRWKKVAILIGIKIIGVSFVVSGDKI